MEIKIKVNDKAEAEDIIDRLIDVDINEYGLPWKEVDDYIQALCLAVGKPYGISEKNIKEKFTCESDE